MNKIILRTVIIISSIFLFSTCKRDIIELEPDSEGTPVFETTVSTTNEVLTFVAGIDDYYMHTRYVVDENDVATYIGQFAREDCTTGLCTSSLQFELRSTQLASETNPDNDILVRNYAYKNDDQDEPADLYHVRLEGSYDAADTDYTTWRFNFGDSIANQPVIVRNFRFEPTEPEFAAFKVVSKQGHIAAQNNQLSTDGMSNCSTDFEVTDDGMGDVQFVANSSGTSDPLLYFWTFGQGSDLSSSITPNPDSLYHLDYTLSVTYADGCYSEMTRTFTQDVNGRAIYNNSTYSYDVLGKTTGGSLLGLSTFTVQYIDPQGVVYRSDRQEQPESSFFRIDHIEAYQTDANGYPTKKLDVSYECYVFGPNGEKMHLRNGNGVIAVAHPN